MTRGGSFARGRSVALALSVGLTAVLLTSPSGAHIRSRVAGLEIFWGSDDLPLTYTIQQDGSDDLDFEAARDAIRTAFETWQSVSLSGWQFEEIGGAAAASRDTTASSHLVLFDEDGSSGYFSSSGVVAITPLWILASSGRLVDADILLNGRDFTFSTDGTSGYDVQSVVTHEVGHFLGLDHTPGVAATMYPFSFPAETRLRSLHEDDEIGARAVSPAPLPSAAGSISGRVVRQSDTSPVAGAHVYARHADGTLARSTVSGGDGTYLLSGLAPGSYEVVAQPLLGPVTATQIGALDSADTDFSAALLGGIASPTSIGVSAGGDSAAGDLAVPATTSVSLTSWLSSPAVVHRGETVIAVVTGAGLDGVDETITVSGSGVTHAAPPSFSPGGYSLLLQVATGAALGSRDLQLTTTTGELALIPGALEIVAAAPQVSGFSPGLLDELGGTALTIEGSDFAAGAHVFVAGRRATNVAVESSTRITCLAPSGSGSATIQVQNPDGQLATAATAVEYGAFPAIELVFPRAGSLNGGTSIAIAGSGFAAGATVKIAGISASVASVTSDLILATTPAGVVGAAAVAVTNPGGFATSAAESFAYLDGADPYISALQPDAGASDGRYEITVEGAGLEEEAIVRFGADVAGRGGVTALGVRLDGGGDLVVTVPSLVPGIHSVTVLNPAGTAARRESAFTAQPAPGGGGGGCSSAPVGGSQPASERSRPVGPWGLLLVLVALLPLRHEWAARRARGTA